MPIISRLQVDFIVYRLLEANYCVITTIHCRVLGTHQNRIFKLVSCKQKGRRQKFIIDDNKNCSFFAIREAIRGDHGSQYFQLERSISLIVQLHSRIFLLKFYKQRKFSAPKWMRKWVLLVDYALVCLSFSCQRMPRCINPFLMTPFSLALQAYSRNS